MIILVIISENSKKVIRIILVIVSENVKKQNNNNFVALFKIICKFP